jgi:hypothetical protein
MLGCSEYLDTLLGEIRVETGEREPWSVNGWLTNLSMKPHTRAFQLHVELFSVRNVKSFDRDNWNAFLLIACRCNRFGRASFRHQT